MVTWPEELGGRDLDYTRWLIFEEEYYRAKAPTRVNHNGIFLLGPTMMEYGTPEQKARFLPRMAAGDDIWAQAWSEPGASSDLAARTAVQVHGAMGMTREVDVHFFLKRIMALRNAWDNEAAHVKEVIDRVMNSPSGPVPRRNSLFREFRIRLWDQTSRVNE